MKKFITIFMAIVLLVAITGCGRQNANTPPQSSGTVQSSTTGTSEKITINWFGTFPDRKSGRGLLEETFMKEFMNQNPNVEIVGEYLVDEAYKPKIQTYMASNDVPDVMFAWSAPNFMDPLLQGNFITELNADDYKDYNFMAGALEAFTINGKLYGLPSQADFWVLYYNEKIFKDNGIKVPTTFDELIEASNKLNEKNITPCAMAGKDKWPLVVAYHSFVEQLTGDPKVVDKALAGEISFANTPEFKQAAEYFKKLIDINFFQRSFLTADYATAKNLFTQGQTAMFMMGSWEMGMGTDDQIEDVVRENIRAMKIPQLPNAKGTNNDICMNYGAGYVVGINENKAIQEKAVELINFILKPENYAKFAWENGILIPVEKYDQYFTGKENNVQKDLTKIMSDATSASGSWICDKLTPSFKTDSEELFHQFATGMIDIDAFLKKLDELAAKAK